MKSVTKQTPATVTAKKKRQYGTITIHRFATCLGISKQHMHRAAPRSDIDRTCNTYIVIFDSWSIMRVMTIMRRCELHQIETMHMQYIFAAIYICCLHHESAYSGNAIIAIQIAIPQHTHKTCQSSEDHSTTSTIGPRWMSLKLERSAFWEFWAETSYNTCNMVIAGLSWYFECLRNHACAAQYCKVLPWIPPKQYTSSARTYAYTCMTCVDHASRIFGLVPDCNLWQGVQDVSGTLLPPRDRDTPNPSPAWSSQQSPICGNTIAIMEACQSSRLQLSLPVLARDLNYEACFWALLLSCFSKFQLCKLLHSLQYTMPCQGMISTTLRLSCVSCVIRPAEWTANHEAMHKTVLSISSSSAFCNGTGYIATLFVHEIHT